MQLIIKAAQVSVMGCRACTGLYRRCSTEPFSPKPSFDTFITVTYTVDWFIAYKCSYRGEALGFWIWLSKNYLHNQVFGSDFPGSDEMDTRRYPFTAPTHRPGQWECEEYIRGSNTFVKCSCESSSLPAIYSTWLTQVSNIFTQLSICR